MKKPFLFLLSCFVITMVYSQNIIREHYTISGGLLGAANFSKFELEGGNLGDIDYNYKTGWSAGGWLNLPVAKRFSIEPQLMYSVYRYHTNNPATLLLKDGRISYFTLPVLLKLHAGDKIAITAGPQVDFFTSFKDNNNTAQEDDFTKTSFSLFGGLEICPHGRVTVFGRYIRGFTDMDEAGNENPPIEYRNQVIQAGLKFKLFGRLVPADSDGDGIADPNDKCPSVPGLAKYDGCPIPDTDADGVNDEMDKCPNVPGLAKYDGCPIPDTDKDGVNDELDKCPTVAGLAKYDGCPIPDTDKDGVNDELDKCPTVAGLAKYDGCPIPDRDGDGINDEEDKCPDIPGVAGKQGCPEVDEKLGKMVSSYGQNISFTTGKATLLAKSNTSLNEVVKVLNANPGMKLRIEAHTDNVGDDDANMELSTARADAVKVYLESKGISEDRLETQGFGETMPIADNKTAAGRVKNRRIELKIVY